MTLGTGAHVKIGTEEFDLDETIDAGPKSMALYRPHYKKGRQSLFAPRTDIEGDPGKQKLRPERLVWFMDDFSGGENNRTFYNDDPTVYDFSFGLNPRVRGQLTGRPTRTYNNTNLATDFIQSPVFLQTGAGGLWFGGGYDLGWSTDAGATWNTITSAHSALKAASTSYRIYAMAGNRDYMFYSAWHSGSSGTNVIYAKKMEDSSTAAVMATAATGIPPVVGMGIMGPRLYTWDGLNLRYYKTWKGAAGFPLPATLVGGTGVAVSNTAPGSTWWGGMTVGENRLWTFTSSNGSSILYQFDGTAFAAFWHPPNGFSIKSICYNNGVLYCGGQWGGDTTATGAGAGALYAHRISDSDGPQPIGFIRKQNRLTLSMDQMCSSHNNQVMIADSRTGRVFIYDADMDQISMLDDLQTTAAQAEGTLSSTRPLPTDALSFPTTSPTKRIGGMITYGDKRLVSIYNGGTSGGTGAGVYEVESYSDDEPANRQAGTATNTYSAILETGTYDFALPFQKKTLMGFDVTFDASTLSGVSGATIQIDYSIDGAAWVTSLAAVATGQTGASTGRVFIPVSTGSSSTAFTALRFRIAAIGTSGVKPPIILGVAAEANIIDFDVVFDLILRIKDALPGTRHGKVATMGRGTEAARYIQATADAKNVVTFLDGYPYPYGKDAVNAGAGDNSGYDTYDVTIENPELILVKKGEGSMMITLRQVPL